VTAKKKEPRRGGWGRCYQGSGNGSKAQLFLFDCPLLSYLPESCAALAFSQLVVVD
jgi:hypothetical protein